MLPITAIQGEHAAVIPGLLIRPLNAALIPVVFLHPFAVWKTLCFDAAGELFPGWTLLWKKCPLVKGVITLICGEKKKKREIGADLLWLQVMDEY